MGDGLGDEFIFIFFPLKVSKSDENLQFIIYLTSFEFPMRSNLLSPRIKKIKEEKFFLIIYTKNSLFSTTNEFKAIEICTIDQIKIVDGSKWAREEI